MSAYNPDNHDTVEQFVKSGEVTAQPVSADDLLAAIDVLLAYEGAPDDDPVIQACANVAALLERQVRQRQTNAAIRSVAREKGIDPAALRRALKARA